MHKLGGFQVQGRDPAQASELVRQACDLEEAGTDILLVECVPAAVGRAVTEAVDVPVIGIGAGGGTDGQILVIYDVLGLSPGKRPRFSKDFLSAATNASEAVRTFAEAVRDGSYPGPEHAYA